MFGSILLAIFFVIPYHAISDAFLGDINSEEIVNTINSNTASTWKADTYGYKIVNLRDFARQKFSTFSKINEKNSFRQTKRSVYVYLPETFSWLRTNKTTCKMNRIGDQSNCKASAIFAAVGSFTDRLCLATNGNMSLPLSTEYVLSCNELYTNCQSGYLNYVLYFLRTNGTITGGYYDSEEGCQVYSVMPCGFPNNFPCASNTSYTPKCKKKTCNNDWYESKSNETLYKIKYFNTFDGYYWNNDYYIRKEMYANGPMISGFSVYSDFMFYKEGIYTCSYTVPYLGYHYVKVVGWGIQNGTKYWEVANSWGSNWGENGFFKIKRGTNECGFENYMFAVIPNATSTQ